VVTKGIYYVSTHLPINTFIILG